MSEVPFAERLYLAQVYSGEYPPPPHGFPIREHVLSPLGLDTPVQTYRPMADSAVYNPVLGHFYANNPLMYTALDALMTVSPAWEDEFNPLHDAGIACAQIPCGQVSALMSYWNAPALVNDVNHAVANNIRMNGVIVYTLVNMTMKSLLSPHRSISHRLMVHLHALWQEWTGYTNADAVMVAVGAVGTTYHEYLPHFMTLVQSYPVGRLLM